MDWSFWLKILVMVGQFVLTIYLSTRKIPQKVKIVVWIFCLLIIVCGVLLLVKEGEERGAEAKSTAYYQNLSERQELFSQHLPSTYIDGLGKNPLLKYYFNEAEKYEEKFQFTKAIEQYQNCLSHPQATEENKVAANISIGNCYYREANSEEVERDYETYRLSKLEEAEKYYKYALKTSKKVNDENKRLEGKSTALLNITMVNHEMGKLKVALRYGKESLDISEKIKHKLKKGECLSRLAIIYMSLGKFDEALVYCQKSLDISKEINELRFAILPYSSFGLVYFKKGNFVEAIRYFKKALELNKKTGVLKEKSTTGYLGIIGVSYRSLGKFDEALQYFREAFEINRKAGYKRAMATNLTSLGSVYQAKGMFDAALRHFDNALKINRKIEDKEAVAANLTDMGLLYWRDLANNSEALSYFKEALQIDREIGLEHQTAFNLSRIGLIYVDLDNSDEALQCFKEALAICKSRKVDPILEIMLEKIIEEESVKKSS